MVETEKVDYSENLCAGAFSDALHSWVFFQDNFAIGNKNERVQTQIHESM